MLDGGAMKSLLGGSYKYISSEPRASSSIILLVHLVVVFDETNTPAFIRRQNHENFCFIKNTDMLTGEVCTNDAD